MQDEVINAKPRNQQIDGLKFLLILSIFIFHFQNAAGGLYSFCSTYQVEAFFAVSGFFAINRVRKPLTATVTDSLKSYLLPWLIWVLIYTFYNTLASNFTFGTMSDIFVRYFSAIRGTGIMGMWFTPIFFVVLVLYTLLSKVGARVFNLSDKGLTVVLFLFSLTLYFVTQYFLKIPRGIIFSLTHVPKFLFYFSMGAFLYNVTYIFKSREELTKGKRAAYQILSAVSAFYMAAVYFDADSILWGWTETVLDGKLTLLPLILTVFFAMCFLNAVAKFISCDFVSRIGRSTLGLCHGEGLIKSLMVMGASLFGLTLQAKSPVETVIFAVAALALGAYVILPAVDKLTEKITHVKKKKSN